MIGEGAYPPGVTGDMIDNYFGADMEDTKEEAVEHFLDELKDDGCLQCEQHKCEFVTDLIYGFLDDNFMIGTGQYEFIRQRCTLCGRMEPEKRDDFLNNEWGNYMDWVNGQWHRFGCVWCYKPLNIYGNFKDPDDEWNEIEKQCGKCKYFDDESEEKKE